MATYALRESTTAHHGSTDYLGIAVTSAILPIYESRGEFQPAGDARYPLSRLQLDGGNYCNIKRSSAIGSPTRRFSKSLDCPDDSKSLVFRPGRLIVIEHAKIAALYLVSDSRIYNLRSADAARNSFNAVTAKFLFLQLYLNVVSFSALRQRF